jgi:hypothetical protein
LLCHSGISPSLNLLLRLTVGIRVRQPLILEPFESLRLYHPRFELLP